MISSKTIDLSILSNYKSSIYTNTIGVIENYSDLRQYIGSEYCLIGGEQNRSPVVEDNGMIKYDNSNSYAQTNEWIPIGDLKVTRVTLKYQKPYTSNTSWYKFSIFLSKLSDTDNEVYTSVVVNDTSTQSQTWYEVDVDFNSIEVNYFKVNAIVGRVFIKDIVIYYQDDEPKSGGAGSGYIGNSLLSNKKMVGYNVPTSSAESTKTESINDVSASAVSGKPKSGNGFARIKFLRDLTNVPLEDMVKNSDFLTDYKNTGGDFSWNGNIFQVSGMSQYRNNDYTLYTCGSYWSDPILLDYSNGVYSIDLPEYNQHSEHWGVYENVGLPLSQHRIIGIDVDFRFDDVVLPLTQWSGAHIPFMRFVFYQPDSTDGIINTNFDIYDKTTDTSKTVSGGAYITCKELSWASGGFIIGDNDWHSLQIRFSNNASYTIDFMSIHQQYIPMHYRNIKFILAD